MKHAGKLFHLVRYVYRPSESVDPTGRLLASGSLLRMLSRASGRSH